MPLWKIKPSVPYFYKDTRDIDFGGRCDALLAQQPLLDHENRFCLDCLRFLIELCSQIKRRFDFSETSILSQMCVLDPKVAMSVSNQRQPKSLAYLASKFPMLVEESQLDQLHDQWKMLPTAVSTLQHMTDLFPDQFWPQIKSVTDGNDTPKFGLLSDFMCTMLTLPHSSACVEQIFSQVNMVKNKFTNRLHTTNMCSRLLAKQAIERNGASACYMWKPSSNLINDLKSGASHKRYAFFLKILTVTFSLKVKSNIMNIYWYLQFTTSDVQSIQKRH